MSYYRNISTIYNDTCVIPRPLDQLYCKLKNQEEDSINIVKQCGNHIQQPFDIIYNSNITDDRMKGKDRYCLRDLGMRVMSHKDTGNCPILKHCLYFEQCYCNDRELENAYNGSIQCICELQAAGGENCTVKRSTPANIYFRHNCTIDGMKERALPNITGCTLHDGPYPFENSYFPSLECPRESVPMFAKQVSGGGNLNQLSTFLPITILLVHMLLLAMIFRRVNDGKESCNKKKKIN